MISVLTQRTFKLLAIRLVKLRRKLTKENATLPRDIFYFGYGANLDIQRFEKYSMNVEGIGVAKLNDSALIFSLPCEYKGKGFASADSLKGSVVWGYLYQMDRLSLLLLDIMEWAMFNHYRKIEVTVETRDGKKYKAITYQSRHPRTDLSPSTQYKNAILKSARNHDFPLEYIQQLESVASQDKFELDPGHSLMFPNKRRILEKQLHGLYLSHDKLRERLCDWLTF